MVPNIGTWKFMTITPEFAAEAMASEDRANGNGSRNRRPSRDTALVYGDDMKHGRWDGRSSVITMTEDGLVPDGWTRLLGCILAGVSFETWVHIVPAGVTSLDLRVDLGRKRSTAWLLGTSGGAVAVATCLNRWADAFSRRPSPDRIRDTLGRIHGEYSRLSATTRRGVTTAPVQAAFCLSMFRYPDDRDSIADEYRKVADATNEVLWPCLHSAVRRLVDDDRTYRGGNSQRDAFLRIVRGLSRESRYASKCQIKDAEGQLASLQPLIRRYAGVDED